MEVYFRKSIDRMKAGGQPFAPTLQVSVEADNLGIDPLKVASTMSSRLSEETEELVKSCMGGKVKEPKRDKNHDMCALFDL